MSSRDDIALPVPASTESGSPAARGFDWALLALLLAALAVVGGAGAYYLKKLDTAAHKDAEMNLAAVAELKIREIVQWRKERLRDAMFIRQTPYASRRAIDALAQPTQARTRLMFTSWLDAIMADGCFKQALLLNAQLDVAMTYPAKPGGRLSEPMRQAAETSLRTRQVIEVDLHRVTEGGPIRLSYVVPLVVRREGTNDNVPAAGTGPNSSDWSKGLLVLNVDPQEFLYPLIQTWPTPSRTAETLLVRREGDEVVYLTELRHRPSAALTLRSPITRDDLPAAMAARGQVGTVAGVDYRGVPVLAAIRAVPGTPWFMVAKVDEEEVYAIFRRQARMVWGGMGLLTVASCLGVALLGRRRDLRSLRRQLQTEKEKSALAERVELLMRNANDIILLTNEQWQIVEANARAVERYGYSREELLQRTLRDLRAPEALTDFDRQDGQVAAGGRATFETVHQRKDGTTFPVEASEKVVNLGGVGYGVAFIRDITERKLLEAQLRQSQKLEGIGQLAGGVAHDFNNLLAVIRGNAELLLMDGERLDAETRDCLSHIAGATERAAGLTRQLLIFSRKQVMQPQPVALNELIGDLTRMLKRVIREDICLDCVYGEPLPFVQADPGMMEQVLLNLVVNARDAMPRGGQIQITTKLVRLAGAEAESTPEARAGDYVCLNVCDTGTGIPPEVLPHIFEPFFTTKDVGKGSGLGLATVYGIVKQHQGWVEVASRVGEGTTFRIFLPAVPAPAKAVAVAPAETVLRGGHETILLVEDDPAVRMVTRRVLETAKYHVLEAASSREALEVWSRHGSEIALVLTDIMMPEGVNGRDLVEKLRAQRPGLKVIFMSGYSAEALGGDTDFFLGPGSVFIHKPCPAGALIRSVRQCLDAG